MAAERSTAPAAQPLPLPPRFSASSSSLATVGALLTKAASVARGAPRECRSPRSLLSLILGRVGSGSGGGGGGGRFGCRLRLPRYCSSGAATKEDAAEEEEMAGPKVVGGQVEFRESPRSSLQGKKEAAATAEVSSASLGLGASLVLLLSKGAAELSRMAELRAQMERLVLDVKADARGTNRSNASDSASVVKEPIAFASEENANDPRTATSACAAGGDAGLRANAAAAAMDQMEAELEAELTRLQLASRNDEDSAETPRRDHQLETEAKSDVSSESGSPTRVDIDNNNDSVIDDGTSAQGCEEDDDDTEEDEEKEEMPAHGGVPAQELERRLHELLQSRHEERIAELESELQRARRKLQEKEREVSRWRDTAKLVSRHKDESRLR